MTEEDLLKIKLMPNMILVKVDKSSYKLKLQCGIILELAWTFEPAQHTPVKGDVIAVCDRLYFKAIKGVPELGSMMWKTDIEIRPGDTVIMNWFSVLSAIGKTADPKNVAQMYTKERVFFVGEEKDIYIVIEYSELLFAIRDIEANGFSNLWDENGKTKAIIPLNGYCFMDSYEEDIPESAIIQLNKKKQFLNHGIIRWSGSCNQEYVRGQYDDPQVTTGQHVIFSKHKGCRVNNKAGGLFSELTYIQRADVFAIIT